MMDAAAAVREALAANGRGDEEHALERLGPVLRLARTDARGSAGLSLRLCRHLADRSPHFRAQLEAREGRRD